MSSLASHDSTGTLPLDSMIGQRIKGRYRIERLHERGGMSVLYAAVDSDKGHAVAVKVLDRDRANDPEAVERFLMEARTQSALEHEHVVAVSDVGRLPDGRPYLVMPLLAGIDMASFLAKEGPQHPARVAALLSGAAAALDAMHARGIVHRDIKPENLMCATREDGEEGVLVLDFGIAAAALGDAAPPPPDPTSGTPEFMPPEALAGQAYDRRGDVYALATVAFELITGRLPFEATDATELASKKASGIARTLSQVTETRFPQAVESIVARGLAKRPELRPRSATQFVRDLATAARLMPSQRNKRGSATATMIGHAGAGVAASSAPPRRRDTRPGYARVTTEPPPAPTAVASTTVGTPAIGESLDPEVGVRRMSSSVPPAPPPSGSVAPPELSTEPPRSQSIIEALKAEAERVNQDDDEDASPSARAAVAEEAVAAATHEVSSDANEAFVALPSKPGLETELVTLRPPDSGSRLVRYSAIGGVLMVALALFVRWSSDAPLATAPSQPRETKPTPNSFTAAAVEPTPADPTPPDPPATAAAPAADEAVAPSAQEPEPSALPLPDVSNDDAIGERPTPEPAVKKVAPKKQPRAREARAAPTKPAEAPARPATSPARPERATLKPSEANSNAQAKSLTQAGVEAMLGGNFDKATKLLDQATAANGRYAPAWRAKGLVLERTGRKAEAVEAFRRYLKLAPAGAAADRVRARLQALE